MMVTNLEVGPIDLSCLKGLAKDLVLLVSVPNLCWLTVKHFPRIFTILRLGSSFSNLKSAVGPGCKNDPLCKAARILELCFLKLAKKSRLNATQSRYRRKSRQ